MGVTNPTVRLRTGGDWIRRSNRERARPNFWDGSPRHLDLCLGTLLFGCMPPRTRMRHRFLAPGATMVLSILMSFAPNRWRPVAVLPGGLIYPKSVFQSGCLSPLMQLSIGTGFHFILRRFVPASRALSRCLPGDDNTRRAVKGQNPNSLCHHFVDPVRAPCPMGRVSTLQRPSERPSPSTSMYPAVLLSGHWAGRFSENCLKQKAWQQSPLALASGQSFTPTYGHLGFSTGYYVSDPGPHDAIATFGAVRLNTAPHSTARACVYLCVSVRV